MSGPMKQVVYETHHLFAYRETTMSSYDIEFSNAHCDEDDLINDIREAFARAEYQVGDCIIITRNCDTGSACVEIHGDEIDILNDPRNFGWNGVEVTIIGLYNGDLM